MAATSESKTKQLKLKNFQKNIIVEIMQWMMGKKYWAAQQVNSSPAWAKFTAYDMEYRVKCIKLSKNLMLIQG